MTVGMPQGKRIKMINLVRHFINLTSCSITDFAQMLGSLVSVCPALEYGWVYTKYLERFKYLAIIKASGDYDKVISLPVSLLKMILFGRNKAYPVLFTTSNNIIIKWRYFVMHL